jgi:hypothetical protein
MTDIADAYAALPKPRIYQLPWPRLNCLLAGLPGFSIEAATQGGLADGEVMVICGETRSFRTTVSIWLAGHFIQEYEKKVTFFSFDEALVREGVAMARLGFPLSTQARPKHLTYWSENGHELDVLPLTQVDGADVAVQLNAADPNTGMIIIDSSPAIWRDAGDLAFATSQLARLRNVPVFCTFQLNRRRLDADGADCALPDRVTSTVAHVLGLDPTSSRRHLVMELLHSREGARGAVLLNGHTLKEVL